MGTNHNLFEFRNLAFQFENHPIFSNVNLSVGKGEKVGLLGLSGAGKSTLLKLACGLLQPVRGEVYRNEYLSRWGYLSQGQNLLPWLTVEANLRLVINQDAAALDRMLLWLEKFRLAQFTRRYPYELSGGMAQKVALIRAFLLSPHMVLLDEPFSHLDLPQKEELYSFTKDLWSQTNATVVLVSHDIDEVLMLTDSIYICSTRGQSVIKSEVSGIKTTSLADLRGHSAYADSYGRLLKLLQCELDHV